MLVDALKFWVLVKIGQQKRTVCVKTVALPLAERTAGKSTRACRTARGIPRHPSLETFARSHPDGRAIIVALCTFTFL